MPDLDSTSIGLSGWTYGFYDSVDHDRTYSARQFSALFEGIINDGVFEAIGNRLMVKAGEGMTVHVDTGRAWFNNTWSNNEALYPITLPAAEMVLPRIDAIVLEVDEEPSTRTNSLKVIKGTPATMPERPKMEDTDTLHQHALAYIRVDPEVAEITQGKITNNVGMNTCPFITGIIETVSAEVLFIQWEAQWKEWFNKYPATWQNFWDEWYKTHPIMWQEAWDEWFRKETSIDETEWANFWERIQGQLSEDAAGHLQQQIDMITDYYVDGDVLFIPSGQASVTDDGILILGATPDAP